MLGYLILMIRIFNILDTEIHVKNEKICYEENNHRPLWLNIIIGNIKDNIIDIYHRITKRWMLLFMNEQEYRFDFRNMEKIVMDVI